MPVRISPIPDGFLERVRADGRDALGQPVRRTVAKGNEPCRDVLRRAAPGEQLILASFSPFVAEGPYHEYGPVFVLANPSGETVRRDVLPLHPAPGSSMEPYLREQFVLRAYSKDESIVGAEMVTAETVSEVLDRFLGSPEVAFVHARFPLYGCFACRIDRC
ncbi:MAG: DUF1203 domain-containing protein [Thermoanaerobaculia bacterium]